MKNKIIFNRQAYVSASQSGDFWTDLELIQQISVTNEEIILTIQRLAAEKLASIVPDPIVYLPPTRSGGKITRGGGYGASTKLVNVTRFEFKIRPVNMEDDTRYIWAPAVRCLNLLSVVNELTKNTGNLDDEFKFTFDVIKPLEWIAPTTKDN